MQKNNKNKKMGFIAQISILIAVCLVLSIGITYIAQYQIAYDSVKKQAVFIASEITEETADSIKEYPAYEWLLDYWYENSADLDIEYDVDFETGTRTLEKAEMLSEHQPGIQIRYVTQEMLESFPSEDQKLYAEIVYSWLITRFNQLKQNYNVSFLYCVLTDNDQSEHPYERQVFLLSGADSGAGRGSNYLEFYPVGTEVSIADNKSLMGAMREAVNSVDLQRVDVEAALHTDRLGIAGNYVDYYKFLMMKDDHVFLIGLTYDISALLKDVRSQTWQGTGNTILYMLILLQILMLAMFIFLLFPLKKVLRNIRLYSQTKNREKVAANLTRNMSGIGGYAIRQNEIGELSEEFMDLMKEIDDYTERIETITADRERIEADLELGARIQTGIMPSKFPPYPDRTEFDLYASMDPAKEVGGDFYDFFLADEDHLAMVIADVSGKGVPAALFMMATKIVINNFVAMRISPAKALELANNRICENNYEDMFVTVWLGVLELSTGKLYAANAGHEYPVIKQPDGSFELYKDKHGFVIGGMEGVKYQEYTVQLQPGARVFVYTDGVPEATNSENELFGNERMVEALRRVENGTPKEILQGVKDSVAGFVADAEQFDDLTMLCVEYKGSDK